MILILIWLFILFTFFGTRILILKKEWYVNDKTSWILLSIHLVTIVLLLTVIILRCFDLSFREYDSSSIIFISCIGTGVPFYLFRKKTFLLPILNYILISICCFTVPALILCIYVTIAQYKTDVYYEDNKYRLETSFKGIMGSKRFPDLFIKKGIIEKKYDLNEEPIGNITDINITEINSDSVQITIYHIPNIYDTRPSPYIIRIRK